MDKYKKISLLAGIQLVIIILFSHLAHADTFEVKVPYTGESRSQPIRDIELFVDLPGTAPGEPDVRITQYSFKITRYSSGVPVLRYFNITLDSGTGSSETLVYGNDETSGERKDKVAISADTGPDEGAETRTRFKILMELESNWDDIGCGDFQDVNETWIIETRPVGVIPAPDIDGACVNSYQAQNNSSCSPLLIQASDSPATINLLTTQQTITPCPERTAAPKPPVIK